MSASQEEFHDKVCLAPQYFHANIFSTTWTATMFVILIVVAIKFLVVYKADQKLENHPPMKTSLIATSIVLVISSCGLIFCIFYNMITCLLGMSHEVSVLNVLLGICWFVHGGCILMVFLARLKNVLRDTQYGYSKKTFITLKILCLVYLGICTTAAILFSFFIGLIGFLLVMVGLLLYMALNAITFWMFIYGLFKIVSNTRTRGSVATIKGSITEKEITDNQVCFIYNIIML